MKSFEVENLVVNELYHSIRDKKIGIPCCGHNLFFSEGTGKKFDMMWAKPYNQCPTGKAGKEVVGKRALCCASVGGRRALV
jgi:hypothetical protein